MNNICKYIIVFLAVVSFGAEFSAGQNTKGSFHIDVIEKRITNGDLEIEARVDISNLTLSRQELVVLTPMLRFRESKDNNIYIFASTAIAGKVRYKTLKREIKFGNTDYDIPSDIVLRKNNSRQEIKLSLSMPYESWVERAELVLVEDVSRCSNCNIVQNEYVTPLFNSTKESELFAKSNGAQITSGSKQPYSDALKFILSMIVPPKEEVKNRHETHSSTLYFEVGKYDLVRDFNDNFEQLNKVDEIISNIKINKNISFKKLSVVGYASPDGYIDGNEPLSKRRALAFVEYLTVEHQIPDNMVYFDWRGEDWEGLREAVENSYFYDKKRVVNIIDRYSNIGQRKVYLKRLDDGNTELYLRENFYPQLRRDEYTISYVVRSYDVVEAKELIYTAPHQLSLQEMFLVASTYEPKSDDFRNAFFTALKYFPNDHIALINVAAIHIEDGNPDKAIVMLTGINRPEAWNNIAIAFVMKENFTIAEQYFKKAADKGCQEAIENLKLLKVWME